MFDYLDPKDGPVVEGLEKFEVVLAKNQPQYRPLTVLRSTRDDGQVMSRWSLTPEQRDAIAKGADIYLTLMTFQRPPQPVLLAVSDGPNPDYFKDAFGLGESPNLDVKAVSDAD